MSNTIEYGGRTSRLSRPGKARIIVKQAGLRTVQQTLGRIASHIRVSQRAVGKALSRWLPVIGPVLIGGYSLMDTRKVGRTAIDTFGRQIEIEADEAGGFQRTGDPAV